MLTRNETASPLTGAGETPDGDVETMAPVPLGWAVMSVVGAAWLETAAATDVCAGTTAAGVEAAMAVLVAPVGR